MIIFDLKRRNCMIIFDLSLYQTNSLGIISSSWLQYLRCHPKKKLNWSHVIVVGDYKHERVEKYSPKKEILPAWGSHKGISGALSITCIKHAS